MQLFYLKVVIFNFQKLINIILFVAQLKTKNIMKNLKLISKLTLVFVTSLVITLNLNAQVKKPTLTVLNIDSKGLTLDAQQLGNILRTECEKLETYDVLDKYDVAYKIEKNKLNIDGCYGKSCLLEISKVITTDYFMTGGVELIGSKITVTIRLINVKNESIEKTKIEEFNNLPNEIQPMINITLRNMFELKNDDELVSKLTKPFDYENTFNNPDQTRVSLEGPRFGYTFIFGENAGILSSKKSEGGFEVNPAFFQFGYQFEKQYLNEGNFQALFEFIPMISGIDQGLIIPSLAVLNGFRNNKNGWEIGFGPIITFAQKLEGAPDPNNKGIFTSVGDLQSKGVTNFTKEKRLDSRGDYELVGSVVLALGKTIKSGRLNIPINFWATIPNSDGFRAGISFGYNSKTN
jgi:hypothetical protein